MKPARVTIRPLEAGDIPEIAAAFQRIGWDKPASQYERYLREQADGARDVAVAFVEDRFAGYLTICWSSSYEPFRREGIPEIVDLNVLPEYRRRGIATRLLDDAERSVSGRAPLAGIGVGMDADYGAAQRLYVARGYLPDGRGLQQHGRAVRYGDAVTVDDGLVLYFTKTLDSG